MADEGKLPLKDLQEQFEKEIEEEQLKNDLNDLKGQIQGLKHKI